MDVEETAKFVAALDAADEMLPDLIRARDRLAQLARAAPWWSDRRWSNMSEAAMGCEMAVDSLERFVKERALIGRAFRDPLIDPPRELTSGW